MVFQDFDQLSERRRVERQRKFRKRVTIAAIVAFVLLVLIVCAIFAIINLDKKGRGPLSSGESSLKDFARAQKLIKTICNGTNYQTSCNDTLSDAAKKNSSLNQPHKFIEVAITAINDEVEKAFNKAKGSDLKTKEEKAALNVCKKVLDDAKEDLKKAISEADPKNLLENLNEKSADLNNWLSAVMSYQQTCVDAFPEGDLRSQMEKNMNITKQHTSNSLAIIQKFSSYLSTLRHTIGTSRRLLESIPHSLDRDGLPPWISYEDRRILESSENDKEIKPHATVAKDGSGNFKSLSAALGAMPKQRNDRYVIYVKEGIYEETVTITQEMTKVTIMGDGSQKSIINGIKNVADGVNMYDTATLVVIGEEFLAKSMGFWNNAGPEKRQAVAARVQSDRSIFVNCRFEGYQNTLWAQTHRQFYRNNVVLGTIDIIFGDAMAIFQNTLITVRKPLDGQQNSILAQARLDNFETTGFVLQNCRIEPHESLQSVKNNVKSYLGRPCKEYSRSVVMESTIGDFIDPEGWVAFKGDFGIKTLYFAEYKNKGGNANTDSRVKWPGFKVIEKEEAAKYTVGSFFPGDWITKTGVPVHLGLFE
ncbi:hypothetical protein Pint_13603 [Pistacia integerrima]|uniref:Uncharacterized protein n=1 Tax=Pistacia integerrima TaxID=434235 RepID=A0ACC0Y9B8_9ROSI|nr:hypothetical protein Pint_13603 [Pistacia integerrima]